MPQYYVYLATNGSRTTIYTGVTRDLARRMCEHKQGLVEGFTKRYRVRLLVYYEASDDIRSAIEREKQIKRWVRRKKIVLVNSVNPERRDLSEHLLGLQTSDPSLRSG